MTAPAPRGLRALLDIVPGEHRPRTGRSGLAALLVLALLLVVAFGGWRPWAGEGRLVRAQFVQADQLVADRTPVRVAGVKVGTVERVQRSPDGRGALVVMTITDHDVRIARDAGAHIRLRTVLAGTRYVDLEPGSPTAAPLGDGVIPMQRTSAQVDWDDVNGMFERDVRLAQRATLKGLRDGLADPAAARRTIDVLGPSLHVMGRSARALRGEQAGDLRRLVAATGRTFDALSRDRGALVGLVRSGARALAVTDEHRGALGAAVEATPRALRSTRTTMTRLDRTLPKLDLLAAELRPGARLVGPAARRLRPALGETERLLKAARPVLRDLPPALRDLASASDEGVPLIGALEPTVDRTADELVPWLRERDEDTKLRLYEAIGPLFSVLSSAAGDFDDNGWFLHFPITPTGDSVLLPCGPDVEPGQLKPCRLLDRALKRPTGKRAGR